MNDDMVSLGSVIDFLLEESKDAFYNIKNIYVAVSLVEKFKPSSEVADKVARHCLKNIFMTNMAIRVAPYASDEVVGDILGQLLKLGSVSASKKIAEMLCKKLDKKQNNNKKEKALT